MMNRKLIYTALSASLLLAACGTDDSDDNAGSAGVEDPAESVNTDTEGTETDTDTNADADAGQEDSDAADEDSSSDNSESDTSDAESGDDASDSGDSADSEAPSLPDASETTSDEQDFKMQVLPAYELTSEEPGRDVLFVKEDDTQFMSISTSDSSDTDYDKALENLNERLAASSSDASPAELTDSSLLPTDSSLEKVKAYRVAAPEGPITSMIFERDGMTVTVMIYDNNDESYYEDFLKMAQTIVPSN